MVRDSLERIRTYAKEVANFLRWYVHEIVIESAAKLGPRLSAAKTYIAAKAAIAKAHLAVAAESLKVNAVRAWQKMELLSCRAWTSTKTGAVRVTHSTEEKIRRIDSSVKRRYHNAASAWRGNQHFTFFFISADGHHVTKKHIRRDELKYAITGLTCFIIGIVAAFGVLVHFAHQNEEQKVELAQFKQTKAAQEETIKELRRMAEENQKQLAYLSKLEDEVRAQMDKNGIALPPKQEVPGAKGGPIAGEIDEMNIVAEQEKNIRLEAEAKKADFESLINTMKNETYRREFTPSQWPTEGGMISSYFGGRANPFDGYSSDWHPGLDIANYYGAPVYAAASGYVISACWYGGYGRYIEINHDFGYRTVYAHMSRMIVSPGEYVSKGQVIGYVGSSGYSTGPHLHFEVKRYGQERNPLRYI